LMIRCRLDSHLFFVYAPSPSAFYPLSLHDALPIWLITLRPRAIEKSAGKLEAEREKPNLRTCRAFVQLSSLPRFYRGTSADRVSPQIQPIDLSLVSVTSARPHMQLVDIGVNLTHPTFARDPRATLDRAYAAGVQQLVLTGTSLADSEAAVGLCRTLDEERRHLF